MNVERERGYREAARVAGVFLCALAVRLIYLHQIRHSPFFEAPLVDAQTYVDMARTLAGGGWIGDKPFWQPPLYPYLLGVVDALFGRSYYLPRLMQCILGSCNAVLIYLVGRRIFSVPVGLIAAAGIVLYGPVLYFDAELLPPVLGVFWNLLLLLLLLRASETRGMIWWLLSGIVLGLSAITIPTALLFVPFVLVWIFVTWRRTGRVEVARPARAAGALILGLVLLIAPVTLRNHLAGDDLVLISYNGGLNFYIGNNPEYDRTVAIRPGPNWVQLTRMPVEQGIEKPSAQSRYFYARSWAFIVSEPLSYLRLMLRKLYLFWSGNEVKRNQDLYFARNYSSLLSLFLWKRHLAFPFGLLAPLALIGMALVPRRRPEVALLLLFFTASMLSVVLFFVTARYRIPAVFPMALFSAYAIQWGVQQFRQQEYRRVLIPALVFVLLLLPINLNVGRMNMEGDAEAHYFLGLAYAARGEGHKAEMAYVKAARLDPGLEEAWSSLGALYASQKRYYRAIDAYIRMTEVAPHRTIAHYNLAGIYMQVGRYDQAIEIYGKYTRIRPDDPEGYFHQAYAYELTGRYDEALDGYGRALRVDPDHVNARYHQAYLLNQRGELDLAIQEYERILRGTPDHADARNNLAGIYFQKGDAPRALAQLQRTVQIHPDHLRAHLNLGGIYTEKGQYPDAITVYRRALDIEPDQPEISRQLAILYRKTGQDSLAFHEMRKYLIHKRGEEVSKAMGVAAEEYLKRLFEDNE